MLRERENEQNAQEGNLRRVKLTNKNGRKRQERNFKRLRRDDKWCFQWLLHRNLPSAATPTLLCQ